MPKTMKAIEDMEVVVKEGKMYCAKCDGRISLYTYGGRKEAFDGCTCDGEKKKA